ncbi:isopentenyl-diphosphate Delta-isomerase [Rubrivirga sp. IMCC45206]|uniref:isopentenyl-diphosphate Delta-isomerase n=1 Tax=Rubrivirga sp. IMCC45206 TaxID=3391614 RepID=UPI00399036DC
MPEHVVLVDAADREIGTAEKLAVHRDGRLHRAVSVFLFDGRGRWLLQRRADGKYHSPGLWSNTACTHPRPGEPPQAAASRRLDEEMGVRCALRPAFARVYRAELPGPEPLVEHELDHVFVGRFDGEPIPAAAEVSGWRWVDAADLRSDLRANPDRYTAWFRILCDEAAEAALALGA